MEGHIPKSIGATQTVLDWFKKQTTRGHGVECGRMLETDVNMIKIYCMKFSKN